MTTADIPAAKRGGLGIDLERLAQQGDGWLTPEDRYALKTYGVCAQVQPGVFMIRVRIPGGRLTPVQARVVADLADRHGHGWVHVSTRQNLELHWVAAREVPTVLRQCEAVGLTNRSTCGHTLRNVMSCPDAGVGLDEPFDCYPDAKRVSDAIVARSAELNCRLPSRINMAFGGCSACQEHARLNDAGFVSTVRDGVPGYQLWGAGSLGTKPFLAILLVDFLPRQQAHAAAAALVDVFVAHGNLDDPKKGRMKFVVERIGEAAFRHAFTEAFHAHRDHDAGGVEEVAVLGDAERAEILRHVPDQGWGKGVRPERTPGRATVTVNVPLGDLTPDELRGLAALAEVRGDGLLHLTRNQNVAVRAVRLASLPVVRAELDRFGLGLAGADEATDVRACTGSAVCSLGITAAPDHGRALLSLPTLARNSNLRVHVSGCPNSCAQHHAADIGLSGAKVRVNGRTRLGYQLWLGADIAEGRLATMLGRVADTDVNQVVGAVVGVWEAVRHRGERFGQTVQRVGEDAFAAHIASVAEGFNPGPDPVDGPEGDEWVAGPVAALAHQAP
ncbi:MAG TPA: nitrite/sulfite reductase [Acidimicrobiales bacterium]|jgi:sulfite reductase beta subunit-like hemoprotein|nr:nitrite/sulfite reductase [Acidimicrobiales bacterium]